MTALIIGSTAAKHWYPDWREPKDLDHFGELMLALDDPVHNDGFNHPKIQEWLAPDPLSRYASPDELLTIKLSHAAWDLRNGSWFKHMNDVVELQKRGAKVDEELYSLLYPVWEERYGKKKVDLNYDKQEFFDDAVRRKYDHDSLHRSVAISPGYPLWANYLKPGSEVAMDMARVWKTFKQDQLKLFWEEIAATALERYVIPSDYTCSPSWAWAQAVKKTVTSLTKGKSSRFIAENYGWYRKSQYPYVGMHRNHTEYLEEI